MEQHFFYTDLPWVALFNQEDDHGKSIFDIDFGRINRIIFISDINTKIFHDIINKHNCYKQKELWLCFMSNCLNCEVLHAIRTANSESSSLKFIFSCNLAIKHPLEDTFYIGGFWNEYGTINSYPINFGDENLPILDYHEFKKTIPESIKIANSITEMKFPNDLYELCSIICLDNWIQSSIQYIKDKITIGKSGKYKTPSIQRISRMSDVLLNHYGTCEDISASIVCILEILGIRSTLVSSSGHAWVIVSINNNSYIWDPTHNITRNPNLHPNALKAIEYSDEFTLVGTQEKYYSFPQLFSDLSKTAYSREHIQEVKQILHEKYNISFSYNSVLSVQSYLIC